MFASKEFVLPLAIVELSSFSSQQAITAQMIMKFHQLEKGEIQCITRIHTVSVRFVLLTSMAHVSQLHTCERFSTLMDGFDGGTALMLACHRVRWLGGLCGAP